MLLLSSADEVIQFKVIVEQLDVCCDFLEEDSITKNRIAIILLDNISEILLHRSCQSLLNADDSAKWIVPPEYDSSKKKKVEKYFDEKIKLIESQSQISQQIIQILHIGHQYRNAIYHRNKHNENTLITISKILFFTVCDLFSKMGGGFPGLIIGFEEPHIWLKKYGYDQRSLDFSVAAQTICHVLQNRIKIERSQIISAFTNDIVKRHAMIQYLIGDELPFLNTPDKIDSLIKRIEFQEKYPKVKDELSANYREAIYKITKRTENLNVECTPEKLNQLKTDFYKNLENRIEQYQPEISYSIIEEALKKIGNWDKIHSIADIFCEYHSIDESLSKLEHYLDLAAMEWNTFIQLEIDRQLGK